MFKKSLATLLIATSFGASAHCPAAFKAEKACFMLDQNVIYVYNQEKKHSGPYMDFADNKISAIKADGKELKFARIARGVFKIENDQVQKNIEIEMASLKGKNKTQVQLKAE